MKRPDKNHCKNQAINRGPSVNNFHTDGLWLFLDVREDQCFTQQDSEEIEGTPFLSQWFIVEVNKRHFSLPDDLVFFPTPFFAPLFLLPSMPTICNDNYFRLSYSEARKAHASSLSFCGGYAMDVLCCVVLTCDVLSYHICCVEGRWNDFLTREKRQNKKKRNKTKQKHTVCFCARTERSKLIPR